MKSDIRSNPGLNQIAGMTAPAASFALSAILLANAGGAPMPPRLRTTAIVPLDALPSLTATLGNTSSSGLIIRTTVPINAAYDLHAFLKGVDRGTGWTNILAEIFGVTRQSVSGWIKSGRMNEAHAIRAKQLRKLFGAIAARQPALGNFLTRQTTAGTPLSLLAQGGDDVVLGLSYNPSPVPLTARNTLTLVTTISIRPWSELREASTAADTYIPERLIPYPSNLEPEMVGIAGGFVTD